MNSSDLQTLLTAPPVSRTAFFAQLVAEPGPQSEMPSDDLLTDSASELMIPAGMPVQPIAPGFPA